MMQRPILRLTLSARDNSGDEMTNTTGIRTFPILVLLSACIFPVWGQADRKIRNNEHNFTLTGPARSVKTANKTALAAFAGDPAAYGERSRFLLVSVRRVTMDLNRLESFMKGGEAIRTFEEAFITSMRPSFPNIQTVEREFQYFGRRPAIQGTFTFAAGKAAMKGRYLIVLVSQQSSFYTFTWSARADRFAKWDRASAIAAASLNIFIQPSKDVVGRLLGIEALGVGF
jgi:hypothetical protein